MSSPPPSAQPPHLQLPTWAEFLSGPEERGGASSNSQPCSLKLLNSRAPGNSSLEQPCFFLCKTEAHGNQGAFARPWSPAVASSPPSFSSIRPLLPGGGIVLSCCPTRPGCPHLHAARYPSPKHHNKCFHIKPELDIHQYSSPWLRGM